MVLSGMAADADVLLDADTWSMYLGELRTGAGRFRAAKKVGLGARQITAWLKNRPALLEEAKDAALEAAEVVEDKLYEAAVAGEPWAVVRWLKERGEGWSEPAAGTGGGLNVGTLNLLVAPEELSRMMAALPAPPAAIEVGSTEVSEP